MNYLWDKSDILRLIFPNRVWTKRDADNVVDAIGTALEIQPQVRLLYDMRNTLQSHPDVYLYFIERCRLMEDSSGGRRPYAVALLFGNEADAMWFRVVLPMMRLTMPATIVLSEPEALRFLAAHAPPPVAVHVLAS